MTQYYVRAKVLPYRIPTGTGVVTVPAYREAGPYDHEHEMMSALVAILEENGGNGTIVEVVKKTDKTHTDRNVYDAFKHVDYYG